jgi:hypothetical protein
VLEPGGELRFMEHLGADGPRKVRAQNWLDQSGVWPLVAGGCHSARDTVAAITAAGFQVDNVCIFTVGSSWMVTNPHVLGSARAPDGPGPSLIMLGPIAGHNMVRVQTRGSAPAGSVISARSTRALAEARLARFAFLPSSLATRYGF